jgi:hypothetical protein
MLLSEEELTRKIGSLDVVRVCHYNFSLGAHVDHSEVFEQLAADGSSSDHEGIKLLHLACAVLSDDYLEISEIFLSFDGKFLDAFCLFGCFLCELVEVEGPELLYGHVFVSDGLDDLLSDDAAEVGTDGREFCLADVAEVVGKLQNIFCLLFGFLQLLDGLLNEVDEDLTFFD